MRELKDGEPCGLHRHCLSHISHPCEGCGRIAGKSEVTRIKMGCYEYKDNKYWIENSGKIIKMKCPETRKWVNAVMYVADKQWADLYIREVEDFKKKFVRIEPIQPRLQL